MNKKNLINTKKVLLQTIYANDLNKNTKNIQCDLIKTKKIDEKFFKKIINNIKPKLINKIIKQTTSEYTQINIIENIILKIAITEIIFYKYTKFKNIINEAIILAKNFSTKKSYTLIKTILKNVIKKNKYNKLIK